MFDPGSKLSYILNSIVKELKLDLGAPYYFEVGRFGMTETISIESREVSVPISNRQGSKRTLYLSSTNSICSTFTASPAVSVAKELLPLRNNYADPNLFNENKLDLQTC